MCLAPGLTLRIPSTLKSCCTVNGRASLNTLFQHSINLVQELSRVRRKDARDRPIIFVAHSLGGLIVKDALDYSNRVQDTHPHLAQIFSVTRGIIFLGTPHRGSAVTPIAKVVASVAQMALRNPRFELIRDLERDSQTLDRIGDNFGRILDRRTMAVWSFAEELAITGIGKVVPGESATIGDPRENRETIHADHISMVKFSTRDDPGYKKVLNSIEMLLEGLGEDLPSPSKQVKSDVGREEFKTFYIIPPLRVPHFDGCITFGNFYRNQGRLKEAEMMYNRALASYEKAWGPVHTSTLTTVNNLGLLYADQGQLKDAEMMYSRALTIKEKAWGPEHSSTLDTINNLGLLYDQGRLKEADLSTSFTSPLPAWTSHSLNTLHVTPARRSIQQEQPH